MELFKQGSELIFVSDLKSDFTIYLEGKKIAEGKESVSFMDPDANYALVFDVVHNDGIEYKIAQRYLPNTSVVNFRDLGGYFTKDNRQVKYGFFYRSASLIHLNGASKEYIETLGLSTVLDFRSEEEIKGNEDELPSNCQYIHSSGIKEMAAQFKGNFDLATLFKSEELSNLETYMMDTYQKLPIDNEAYRILMNCVKNDESPLLFHCTAGKDRTGMAAALILLLLGVDEETVMEDYLVSNVYRQEENEKMFLLAPNYKSEIEKVVNVYECYLNVSLNAIKDKYEDYETYFEKEFQLNQEQIHEIRNKYLYPRG